MSHIQQGTFAITLTENFLMLCAAKLEERILKTIIGLEITAR